MELTALLAIGSALLAVGVVVGLYVSRQRTLSRRVGSFTCLMRPEGPDGSWTAGTAQYCADRLDWWRTLTLTPRPARSWLREELALLERAPLGQVDHTGRPLMQVSCRHRDETFQLTLSVSACAGLVSWLESGPRRVGRRS